MCGLRCKFMVSNWIVNPDCREDAIPLRTDIKLLWYSMKEKIGRLIAKHSFVNLLLLYFRLERKITYLNEGTYGMRFRFYTGF